MSELGYDLTTHDSKSLDEIPAVEYEYVITMGCGDNCPFVRANQREDWNIPDPRNMAEPEFRKVRDIIEKQVQQLLNKL